MKSWKSVLLRVAGLALVAGPLPAFAQSCALCYTQAASATQQFIQGLRSGILILIVPPFLMWTAALVVIYRRRNQFRSDQPDNTYSSW